MCIYCVQFLYLGFAGTAVEDLVFVYRNMDYVECTWRGSSKMPANSQLDLYYWYVMRQSKTVFSHTTR